MQTRFPGARKPTQARENKVLPIKSRAKGVSAGSKGLPTLENSEEDATLNLARGQVWKTEEHYLQILDVGKTLVHYRRAVRPDTKGTPVKINSREEILTYLRKHQAVLVTDSAFKSK
jgi:hypothetical protein